MSANPQFDGIVALPAAPSPAEPTNGHKVEIAPPEPQHAPAEASVAQVQQVVAPERPKRIRPAWRATLAVGAVALLAASALGYDAYAAAAQRDGVYKVLVTTDDHTYEVEGDVWSNIPLRNRREGMVTRIAEGMTRWSCGDLSGAGLSEYLDQIIDDTPVGTNEGI